MSDDPDAIPDGGLDDFEAEMRERMSTLETTVEQVNSTQTDILNEVSKIDAEGLEEPEEIVEQHETMWFWFKVVRYAGGAFMALASGGIITTEFL